MELQPSIKILVSTALSCLPTSSGKHDLSFAHTLTSEERDWLIKTTGVRMGKKHSFSAILAIAAAKLCLEKTSDFPKRLGVISAGGPIHLQTAFNLTRSIRMEGPEYLDPLRFPHSIPSSVPTSVAAACNAKAFAFALGYDREAIFEGIEQARRFIKADLADTVLVVAANDSQDLVGRAVRKVRGATAVDAGICAMLTRLEVRTPFLELLQSSRVKIPQSPVISTSESASRQQLTDEDNGIDACAATGGVLLHTRAMKTFRGMEPDRSQQFCVSILAGVQALDIILKWRFDAVSHR